MLGVHQLAAVDYIGAQTTFEEYQSVADDSDEPSATSMADGRLSITRILSKSAQEEDHSALVQDLSGDTDGQSYVRQMDTVLGRFRN